MNTTRKAVAAGRFYAGSKEELEQQLETCFLDERRGPGAKPEGKKKENDVQGLIGPHAGYPFSGAIAAHAYQKLNGSKDVDTFIIIGPNHTGAGAEVAVSPKRSWQTPLGEVPVNRELADRLQEKGIMEDERAHQYEHSIEVQLPFLQYIYKDEFDFVPICMRRQDAETSRNIGDSINTVIEENKGKTVVIASTDFSHVGFNYMSMPPGGTPVNEYAAEQDKKAIDQITSFDPEGLIRTVEEEKISMCGYGCVAAMLHATHRQNADTAELLKYGSSYEVHPGDSCVGYAAFVIY